MPRYRPETILLPDGLRTGWLLETDGEGGILNVMPDEPQLPAESLPGTLLPGLVNAHCHIELSALKGLVPLGQGMAAFIRGVVATRRQLAPAEMEAAAAAALRDMRQYGIRLVGDIANDLTSLPAKRHSLLRVHTFAEALGLDPSRAKAALDKTLEVARIFQENGLSASSTLHAPYSVSAELVRLFWENEPECVSIHLLESEQESAYFTGLEGPLAVSFTQMGLPLPDCAGWQPDSWVMNGAPARQNGLFVHLTEAKPNDLKRIAEAFPNMTFCLCPRSNEALHGTFPDLEGLWPYRARICLGTDSLASNPDLNVWEEARALARRFPWLTVEWLLLALTAIPARALGLAHAFGVFAPGARPGVLLATGLNHPGGLAAAPQPIVIEG